MKKIIILASILTVLLSACAEKTENITFVAVIDSVEESSLGVTTSDDVGFDKANVGYDSELKLDFTPQEGQTVEITILPQIRESYPVGVTAVKIELSEESIAGEYQKITPEVAKEMMDGEQDIIIVDVRTQEEYNEGYIQGAILLPDTDIEARSQTVLPDKTATILVYCRSGRRSEIAAQALVDMGYTGVLDFGGIIDWPYEVVTPKKNDI